VSTAKNSRKFRKHKVIGTALAVAIMAPALTFSASAQDKPIKIFVIGGKADDPFWSRVKRGADDAGKVVTANGGSVTWLGPQNYDNLGPDAAKLMESAVAQGATGIVFADWVPEAQDAAAKAAISKGVAVMVYNSGGMDAANKLGALNYIGSEERTAGKGGGEWFAKAGKRNVICVNTLPGAVNTEARCKGVAEGIQAKGKSTQLPLPSSQFGDPTKVAAAIKAALAKDKTIDGVITISAGDANAAATGIEQAGVGSKVSLGTFDIDDTNLKRIKDGKQGFCIDQQPYLQGFLATSMLFSYVKWGLNLPGRPTLTGPAIVDKTNVDAVVAGAKAGVR
jgi:simple sugar transport system substrate-binding protein